MLLEKFMTLRRQDPRTSLTYVRPRCQQWCVGANLPQITPGMRWADVETSLTPTTPWVRLGPLCGNASYACTLDTLGLCVETRLTPTTIWPLWMGLQKRAFHIFYSTYYTLDTVGARADEGLTPITPWVGLWRRILYLLHHGHFGHLGCV